MGPLTLLNQDYFINSIVRIVINGEGVPFAGIGKVINSEFFGADVLVTVVLGNTQVLVRGRPNIMPQPGTEVRVSAMPGTIHELPADGES